MTDTLFPTDPTPAPMRVPPGEHPRARRADPITAKRAADTARAVSASRRQAILDAFAEHGPMTDDELCKAIGVPERQWGSIKTARSRYANCGEPLVEPVPGEYRMSDMGSPQIVWRRVDG